MKWIVGLDLRADSEGAIAMASWLGQHTTTPDRHRFIGVHVLAEPLRVALRDDEVDEALGRAEQLARQGVESMDAKDAFTRIEAVEGPDPETVLEAAGTYHGAESILIGRHGPTEQLTLVRLGRVARRMVRQLPVPVMVVPPDLDADQIGDGPVVVAVDCTKNALAACGYARRLADTLSRQLVLIHVLPSPIDLEFAYLPEQMIQAFHQRNIHQDESAVEAWVQEHGLRVDRVMVEAGGTVPVLVKTADELGAPMIVCGSRKLSLQERVFQSSVGTELARSARCAVAIVPP